MPKIDRDSTTAFDGFVSYSHIDRHFAVALERLLSGLSRHATKRGGLQIFREEKSPAATANLVRSLEVVIRSSRVTVVICSVASRGPERVDKEIALRLASQGDEQSELEQPVEPDRDLGGCLRPSATEERAVQRVADR